MKSPFAFLLLISLLVGTTSVAGQTPTDSQKQKIILGQVGLSFYAVVGGIVRELLERKGYGVEVVQGPHAEIFPRLGAGEVDIFAAAWLPQGHATLYASVEDVTFPIAPLYKDARFFWVVPAYVPESVLSSVADLVQPDVQQRVSKRIVSLPAETGLFNTGLSAVVAGAGAVWVASGAGAVLKVDPQTGALVDRIDVGMAPVDLALDGPVLWVVHVGGYLVRVDTRTDKVMRSFPAAEFPRAVAAAAGTVWITEAPREGGGVVWRIDQDASPAVERATSLPTPPVGIAAGGGAIWIAGPAAGTVIELDSRSGRTLRTITIGNAPLDVACLHDRVWVTVAEAPADTG